MVLAACGSSGGAGSGSGDPHALLKQTFSGGHTVKSGVLAFSLQATPSGSQTLTTPVTLSLSGPFQSRGKGKLPASAFTVSGSAMGQQGSFRVTSTGTHGYVTLDGDSYQLPDTDVKQLQSSFSSGSSQSSGVPSLSSLGIHPLHWLTNPQIVGTQTVGGAQTTHIRAHVDVAALIADLKTALAKASNSAASKGAHIPSQIPAATVRKIASAIQHPTVDVWTGKRDTTLRKLALNLRIPVTGKASTELGGMTSATIAVNASYSQLNQPQTISAPAHPRSFKAFQAKLQSLGRQLQGALGGFGSTGSTSSGSGSAGPRANVPKYAHCIQSAGGNVAKMQKCAALLNGSGQ